MAGWKLPAALAVIVRSVLWTGAVLLFLYGLFTDAPIMWGRIGLLFLGGFVAYLVLTLLAMVLHDGD